MYELTDDDKALVLETVMKVFEPYGRLKDVNLTMDNPMLFNLSIGCSNGEKTAKEVFNGIFHSLGLVDKDVNLELEDWCDYCGMFHDEENHKYFAVFNHPAILNFGPASEEYGLTLKGMFLGEGESPNPESGAQV